MPRLIPAERKAEARRLRSEGASINQIVARTGMAKSSVSVLVRDIPLADNQRAELANAARAKTVLGQLTWSRACRRRRRLAQLMGRAFAELEDPGYTAGVMLYSPSSKQVHRPLLYGTASVSISSTFLIQSIYGAIQEIGGFDRPEWLDLGGAMPEDVGDADRTGARVGG